MHYWNCGRNEKKIIYHNRNNTFIKFNVNSFSGQTKTNTCKVFACLTKEHEFIESILELNVAHIPVELNGVFGCFEGAKAV